MLKGWLDSDILYHKLDSIASTITIFLHPANKLENTLYPLLFKRLAKKGYPHNET